jgi:hypothetical protein
MTSDAEQLVWAISGVVITVVLAAALVYWSVQESRERSGDANATPGADPHTPTEPSEDSSDPHP